MHGRLWFHESETDLQIMNRYKSVSTHRQYHDTFSNPIPYTVSAVQTHNSSHNAEPSLKFYTYSREIACFHGTRRITLLSL